MRRITFGLAAAVAGFVVAPNLASALSAVVAEPTELRAGPAYDFPVVDSIPADVRVNVHGCVRAYRWCDVSWRDARGWVPGNELAYLHQGRRVTIVDYGPTIGLPVVAFSFDTYWDRHYRGRRWYGERARWRTVWREHERGDRRTGERIRDGREGRTDRRTERRDMERSDRNVERTDRNRELERTDRTRERTDRTRERTERTDRTRERTERGRDERRREAERPDRQERPNVRTGRGEMERGEARGYNPPSNRGPRQDMDRGPRQDANPGRGQGQPSMGPRGGGGERAGGGERGGGGGGGREERRGN
jgi:uncharacterized protein YraI